MAAKARGIIRDVEKTEKEREQKNLIENQRQEIIYQDYVKKEFNKNMENFEDNIACRARSKTRYIYAYDFYSKYKTVIAGIEYNSEEMPGKLTNRTETERKTCDMIYDMFKQVNKEKKWEFTVKNNCNDSDKDVTVSW